MAKKRFKAEEIVIKLREVEIFTNKGMGTPEACRNIGISEQTYYRWRKQYGGMKIDQAKKYKALEQENIRLKNIRMTLQIFKKCLFINFYFSCCLSNV